MSDSRIAMLLRVFETREYAEEFRHGRIRLRTLGYYRNLEGKDVRGDRMEGLKAILQPVEGSVLKVGEVEIPGEKWGAPLLVHANETLGFHVLCMHAVPRPNAPVRKEDLQRLKGEMALDARCFKFGSSAVVVTNGTEFVNRIRVAMKRLDVAGMADLVQYYNEATFQGVFENDDIPFRKPDRCAYQREYRVVFDFPDAEDPHYIDIGDMTDITLLVASDRINELMDIRFKSDPPPPLHSSHPPLEPQ